MSKTCINNSTVSVKKSRKKEFFERARKLVGLGGKKKTPKPGSTKGLLSAEVWTSGSFIKTDEGHAQCTTCDKILKSSTGNLKYHALSHDIAFESHPARAPRTAPLYKDAKDKLDHALTR